MKYLGTTIDEIATHKAGIIKPGIPVVIGPTVPFSIIKDEIDLQTSKCGQKIEKSKLFTIGTHMPWTSNLIGNELDNENYSNLNLKFAMAQAQVRQEEEKLNDKQNRLLQDQISSIRSKTDAHEKNQENFHKKHNKHKKNKKNNVIKNGSLLTFEESIEKHENVKFSSFDAENTAIAQLALRVLCNEYILPIMDGKARTINKLSAPTLANRNANKTTQYSVLDNLVIIRPKCRMECFSLKNVKLNWSKGKGASGTMVHVIFDVSHNCGGINAFFQSLQVKYLNNYANTSKKLANDVYFPKHRFNYRCVIGLSKQNKNELKTCLREIMKYVKYIHFVENTLVKMKSVSVDDLKTTFKEIEREIENENNGGGGTNIAQIVELPNDGVKTKSKKRNIVKQVRYAVRLCCDKNSQIYFKNEENQKDKLNIHNGQRELSHSGNSIASGLSVNSLGLGMTPPQLNTASTTEDSDGGDKKQDSSIENSVSAEIVDSADKAEIVIVLGSFYIMNQARKAIGIKEPTDNIEYK